MIFPSFKMPSERFLFKNFETGITFCHIRFFNFQNLVRSCQHLGGTLFRCKFMTNTLYIHLNLNVRFFAIIKQLSVSEEATGFFIAFINIDMKIIFKLDFILHLALYEVKLLFSIGYTEEKSI